MMSTPNKRVTRPQKQQQQQQQQQNGHHPSAPARLSAAWPSSSPPSFLAFLATTVGLLWAGTSLLAYHSLPTPYSGTGISIGTSTGGNNNNNNNNCATTTYTLDDPPPDRPYHVLHVVTSRFMVGQPHQPVLARARYRLFETFCYPTMRYQTQQNFYWVVLADPNLDPAVIGDLTTLLGGLPSQNAFLVLTNNTAWAADGVGVPGVSSYGAGLHEIAQAYKDGRVEVVTGRTAYLLRALEKYDNSQRQPRGGAADSKPLLIVETLLDADDGLNNRGIQWIQSVAVEHTVRQQAAFSVSPSPPSVSLNSTWWLMCGTDHIEWHNRDIFQLTDHQFEAMGLTSGLTGVRHAPTYCASAGYTRVGLTNPGGNAEDYYDSNKTSILFPLEAYSNHALAFEFPLCHEGVRGDPNITLARCFRRAFPNLLYVLKSRSITSDSMDHMNPKRNDYRDLQWEDKTDHPLWINETERTWKVLVDEFSIDRIQAWNTSIYLRENAATIVTQNKESRCAPGFPCRLVAEKVFSKMDEHFKMLARKNVMDAVKKLPSKQAGSVDAVKKQPSNQAGGAPKKR